MRGLRELNALRAWLFYTVFEDENTNGQTKNFSSEKLNICRKSEHLKTKHGGALVAINDHIKHEEIILPNAKMKLLSSKLTQNQNTHFYVISIIHLTTVHINGILKISNNSLMIYAKSPETKTKIVKSQLQAISKANWSQMSSY